MSQCTICQHAKVQAIEASMNAGIRAAVVAMQYRIKKLDLVKHFQHAPIQVLAGIHDSPVELESTIFPCQPAPLLEGLRRLSAFVEATEASTVPADPIRLVKQHVTEAARIWWAEVEEDRRSPERLQLILAEAFADPNLGL